LRSHHRTLGQLRSWPRPAYVIPGGSRSWVQAPLGRRRRRGCRRHRRIGGTFCTGMAADTMAAAGIPHRRPPPRRRGGGTRRTTRRHRVTMRGPRLAGRRLRSRQKVTTDRPASRTTAPTLTRCRSATRRRARTGTGWTTKAADTRLSAGMVVAAAAAAAGETAVT